MGVPRFDRPLIQQEARKITEREVLKFGVLPEVTVTPAGHVMPIAWTALPGASEAEVTSASVEIGPSNRGVVESVQSTAKDGVYELAIPAHKRVRSIDLTSLRWVHNVQNSEGEEEQVKTALHNSADLGGAVRITVSAPDTKNQMTTMYAVPAVGARNGVPALFLGANLSNSVLSVPELDARKLRIGLVDQAAPEDWTNQAVELASSVGASLVTVATDLSLLGPDGEAVWGFPGELATTTPNATADLRAPIEAFFTTALKEKRVLSGEITLKAANTAPVGLRFSAPRGALIRRIASVPPLTLEGDAVIAPFTQPPEPPLPTEQPSLATASVSVSYAGIRLLENVQSVVPINRDVRGVIVRADPILSALPAAALKGQSVARVGLIGRPPEACELSVQFVDARTSPPRALGAPGVLRLDTSEADIRTVWIELPLIDTGDVPVTISVRATRGRFFWCADAQPLVRIAVHDPNPGGRPIRLGSAAVHDVTSEETSLPAVSLPTAPFGGTTPQFSSDLFVTIELADVVLRYAR